MPDSIIVDVNGKPIQRKALKEEWAAPSLTGVRQAWLVDTVAGDLTPARLAMLLQSANEGNDYDYLVLAEEMEEREPHYGSVLSTRKLAVEGLPIKVVPVDDSSQSKRLTDAVEALTKKPIFEELISDQLDGLGKGRSSNEIMWSFGSSHWEPKKYKWRDPKYFKYNPDDPYELRIIDEQDLHKGLPLPAYKFITHVPKLRTGIPCRSGIARLVAVSYMCKSFTLRDWMAFSELFGLPIRVGKYGANASDKDLAKLKSALAGIGTDAAGMIPDSMQIEFIERTGGAGSAHQLFKELQEWLDKSISKAVLGQTGTTEGTAGKLGNDDAQENVRSDLLKADAKQLSRTINEQLIKPYIDLNFGVQKSYPIVKFHVEDAEDLKLLIDAVDKMVSRGLRVKQSEIRNKLNLSEPEGDDELLQIPSNNEPTEIANNHQCPSCHSTALNRESKQTDDIDELVEDGLIDWKQIVNPMYQPILDLLEESKDEEEFNARLPELLDKMDASELIRGLATQTFKARGIGNTDA